MKMLKLNGALACVAAILGLTALADAQAQTVTQSGYTAIFQGISQETATISGSSVGGGTAHAYVMKINLDAPGVSFTTSPGAPGDTPNSGTGNEVITQTTGQFMAATGVQVIVAVVVLTIVLSFTALSTAVLYYDLVARRRAPAR